MNSTMRKLAVLALLGMLSVASSERALLAHKPNSGTTLHGLALTSAASFSTNGNGTWGSPSSALSSVFTNNVGAGKSNLASSAYATSAGAAIPFTGVTSVAFPSKNLGVAVALGGVTAGASAAVSPTILITIDGVCSWLTVTNLPSFTVPSGANPTTFFSATPDFTSVWAASKSLIWAAGGVLPTTASAVTLASPSQTAPSTQFPAAAFPITGSNGLLYTGGSPVIYQSTNGGTCWTALSLPTLPPVSISSVNYPQSLGAILSIAADSHGKAVYAVGGPSTGSAVSSSSGTAATAPVLVYATAISGTTTGTLATANQGAIAIPVASGAFKGPMAGTILFSNAYGQNVTGVPSFQIQTAPVLPGYAYWLNGVTVLRSTIAFAVGGNVYGTIGTALNALSTSTSATNGIILGTFNGGFTWTQQVLPSTFSYPSATAPFSGAFGGFANGTLPQLYAAANQLAKGSGSTTVWAVGAYGFAVKAVITPNSNSYSNTPFAPAVTFTPVTGLGSSALYGITWDNANVGYAWGAGGIFATSNGGSTWVSQTPNALISPSAVSVLALATVPTTY